MIKNIVLLLLCLNSLIAFGNDIDYVERQEAYVDAALLSSTGNKITLQAYNDLPIDPVQLGEVLSNLPTKYDSDFQIVELIRVLFYSDGLYDDDILPVLDDIPFWLNEGDTTRTYWSENHMIMWMSSEWLLHERYDRPIDSTLYPRLIHYLELKEEYGYYEFFSSVYFPYTLSGLLNLYEFSEDPLIKQLAKKAAQRLLKDLLKPTTDMGVYFPAAGRNYPEKYVNPYGGNHSSIIYLLTGFGEVPTRASHAGAFLATSSLPVDEVINSWTPSLDTLVYVGHSFESSFAIHSEMTPTDQVIFQWSAGGYAHPEIIQETFQLLADSSLWDHKDWDILQPLSFLPPESAPNVAEEVSVISYSSGLTGHNIRIFKNNSIALMSVHELWKGKVGFQQWPFAATVGTTAVYTASGEVISEWGDRGRNIENTHLPHVEQSSNLALVMYRPEPISALIDNFAGELFEDKEVALFWQEDAYDEIVEDGHWLMGRQDENYVAVKRSCTEMLNTWWACDTGEGQTWVIMVGDSSMYGSFNDFQNIIALSQFSEDWSYDPVTSQSIYHAEILVDTFSVEYSWGVDSLFTSIETPIQAEPIFSIYPNPSNGYVTINLNSMVDQSINIRVMNTLGQEVYYEQIDSSLASSSIIQTSNWETGMYTILVESMGKQYYQKLIKL
ncbi:MAG: hypothetical protein ACI94Y_002289 [Maribacter sp.]|jgi:hypothetical protein